ncbi:MAG: DUF11 domain-containing protein, partial [Gammaproteobacteria bacterium]|nr:DUF11 domain-containing protein [Gammaproteobacteria bacterium]
DLGTDITNIATADSDQTDPETDTNTVTVLSRIEGHLYIDANGNGTQDVGEPDLANVDLTITDSNGAIQTVTTDTNGNWIAAVPPGTTIADVDENDPDYPTGTTQTEGDDPTTINALSGAFTNGGIDGFFLPGTLIGHIYEDINGNGVQDAGEPDLVGVDVIVTDSEGNTQTVTTNADGNWIAEDLPPGDAIIDIDDNTLPTGSTLATLVQTEGADPNTVVVVAGADTDAGIDGYNRQADVSIVKTDDGSNAVAGEQYEYTLTVSNAGPWDANEIVVVDTLPAGMSFVSANGASCTTNGQVITCDAFDIIVGGPDVIITIIVDVASSVASGTLFNIATANGIETDPDLTNNEDDEPTDVVREADLSITKDDGVTQVIAGDGVTYTYTITVDNSGPSDADNVTVTEDSFPAGFTMGTVTPSQGTSTGFPYNLGTIASGGQATITVEYTVPSDTQAGPQTNTVSVTSDEPDPNADNNTDSDTNEVLTDINLSIVKTFIPAAIEVPGYFPEIHHRGK